MQAERAPFVGIVLALLIVAAETAGLVAYVRAPQPAAASVGNPPTQSYPAFKRLKIRCRR